MNTIDGPRPVSHSHRGHSAVRPEQTALSYQLDRLQAELDAIPADEE